MLYKPLGLDGFGGGPSIIQRGNISFPLLITLFHLLALSYVISYYNKRIATTLSAVHLNPDYRRVNKSKIRGIRSYNTITFNPSSAKPR